MLTAILMMALSIVSCIDNHDNPVVYAPLEEVLANKELFSDIKENPDTMAMQEKEMGELNYLS